MTYELVSHIVNETPSRSLLFDEASIARVRITTGTAAPGRDDDERQDIVMMDDFIFGEPQALP